MTPPADHRTGLVLSGGGAYAAYEIGVMTGLLLGLCPSTGYVPLRPDIVTGTSAGAFNAALLLSGGPDPIASIRWLQQLWTERVAGDSASSGNSAYRIRGNPLNLIDPAHGTTRAAAVLDLLEDAFLFGRDMLERSINFVESAGGLEQRILESFDFELFVSAEPFHRLLDEFLQPDRIRRSPVRLRVATTNWRTGALCVFGNEHMSPGVASDIVAASAAIPGLFPSVEIHGDPHVDGGLVMNVPLKPAIDAGADVLHAIYMDPDIEHLPLPRLRNAFSSAYRMLAIGFARAMTQDIEMARRTNEALLAVQGGGGAAGAAGHSTRLLRAAGNPYRPLQIHRYHPLNDLGGVFRWLTFDRRQIEWLMARGVVDVANHDCVASRCVLIP